MRPAYAWTKNDSAAQSKDGLLDAVTNGIARGISLIAIAVPEVVIDVQDNHQTDRDRRGAK